MRREIQQSRCDEISEWTICSVALQVSKLWIWERFRSWYRMDLQIDDIWLLNVMFESPMAPRFRHLSEGLMSDFIICMGSLDIFFSSPLDPKNINEKHEKFRLESSAIVVVDTCNGV